MHATVKLVSVLGVVVLVASGCAHKPTTIQAPEQEYMPKGHQGAPWKIGGVFDRRTRDITITFNGNNVLQGTIPPHYPIVNLQGKYLNRPVAARCEFAANTGGGRRERFVYQAVRKNATNSCQIQVDGQEATWLYF